MRTTLSIIPLLVIALIGCSTQNEEENPNLFAVDAQTKFSNDNNAFTTFDVYIENLGSEETGYPVVLSPGIYLVQKKDSKPLFMPWEADYGQGLEAIAEDGNPSMLNMNLENHPKVRTQGTFGSGPIGPGGIYEFKITAKYKDYLNFATMYVQSNDLFISPDAQGIALFEGVKKPISGEITMYLDLWDAGTEVNEEPGIGPNQAPRQSGPDTGETENGVVRLVDDNYVYPDLSEIIRVTIIPKQEN